MTAGGCSRLNWGEPHLDTPLGQPNRGCSISEVGPPPRDWTISFISPDLHSAESAPNSPSLEDKGNMQLSSKQDSCARRSRAARGMQPSGRMHNGSLDSWRKGFYTKTSSKQTRPSSDKAQLDITLGRRAGPIFSSRLMKPLTLRLYWAKQKPRGSRLSIDVLPVSSVLWYSHSFQTSLCIASG